MSGAGIVVVGDVMTDIIVRPHGHMVKGADCHADITLAPGGSAANLAVWLGFLKADVTFAGIVSQDDHERFTQHFARFGVKAHLAASSTHGTGRLVVLIDAAGERSFFTDRAANDTLSADHVPPSLLAGARHLHISAYALFHPGPRAAITQVMAAAQSARLSISVDASSSGWLEALGPETFFALTRPVDMLVANRQEAEVLSGETEPSAQLAALARHYRTVLLKRGEEGADVWHDGRTLHRDAMDAACIDSTGAGDAFLAGFLPCHLAGGTVADALEKATAMGAMAVGQRGAQPRSVMHE